jgi:hypothetical protein
MGAWSDISTGVLAMATGAESGPDSPDGIFIEVNLTPTL